MNHDREADSDGHLLLLIYREHGLDAAGRLAGPFAWVLWDEHRQQLTAVRDRIGVQGLYYTTHNDTLWLAEQVETLLQTVPDRRVCNPRAVISHLHGRAPSPGETFYQDVHAIEPGAALTVTSTKIQIASYWQIDRQPLLRLASDTAYAEAYRDTLYPVVDQYMPQGPAVITLSSGLDSTSVAIKATRPDAALTACSFIAPELPESDEAELIDKVKRHLALPAITVHADQLWTLSCEEGIHTFASTPFSTPFAELWDNIYREVRRADLPIIISGLSGDHLFGYDVFSYADLFMTGRWLQLVREINQHLPHSKLGLKGIIRQMLLGPMLRAYCPRCRNPAREPVPWLGRRYHSLYRTEVAVPPKRDWLLPGRQQRLNLLRDPALASIMQNVRQEAAPHGLEWRHPLLDHRLIEFAASLPSSQTFRAAQRKIVVRNAMRGHLPDAILDRFDKIYPEAISRRGLKEREQKKVWHYLTDMRAAELGFVDEALVQQTYRAYLEGKSGSMFWWTLTLEDWLRRYF